MGVPSQPPSPDCQIFDRNLYARTSRNQVRRSAQADQPRSAHQLRFSKHPSSLLRRSSSHLSSRLTMTRTRSSLIPLHLLILRMREPHEEEELLQRRTGTGKRRRKSSEQGSIRIQGQVRARLGQRRSVRTCSLFSVDGGGVMNMVFFSGVESYLMDSQFYLISSHVFAHARTPSALLLPFTLLHQFCPIAKGSDPTLERNSVGKS